MKKLFSSFVLIAALALNAEVLAQYCNYTMSMFSQLSSGQTDSESATLAGNDLGDVQPELQEQVPATLPT